MSATWTVKPEAAFWAHSSLEKLNKIRNWTSTTWITKELAAKNTLSHLILLAHSRFRSLREILNHHPSLGCGSGNVKYHTKWTNKKRCLIVIQATRIRMQRFFEPHPYLEIKDLLKKSGNPPKVFHMLHPKMAPNRRFLLVSPSFLHSLKLTCPLKRDYFNRKYIFQPSIFRGYVSFREGRFHAHLWGGFPDEIPSSHSRLTAVGRIKALKGQLRATLLQALAAAYRRSFKSTIGVIGLGGWSTSWLHLDYGRYPIQPHIKLGNFLICDMVGTNSSKSL